MYDFYMYLMNARELLLHKYVVFKVFLWCCCNKKVERIKEEANDILKYLDKILFCFNLNSDTLLVNQKIKVCLF